MKCSKRDSDFSDRLLRLANRFAHLFDFAHRGRGVVAALFELANLAGKAVLFFFEPLQVRQRVAPLAIHRHELRPIDIDPTRRHALFYTRQIVAQKFHIQHENPLGQFKRVFHMFDDRLVPRPGNTDDIEARVALVKLLLTQEKLRRLHHLSLLSRLHGLQRCAEPVTGAGFYLDEDDHAAV
jgi:hypothetical protein